MESKARVESSDPNVIIYSPNSSGYKQLYNYFLFKQKGNCKLCNRAIEQGSIIVKKDGHPSKYYHEHCARQVNIL